MNRRFLLLLVTILLFIFALVFNLGFLESIGFFLFGILIGTISYNNGKRMLILVGIVGAAIAFFAVPFDIWMGWFKLSEAIFRHIILFSIFLIGILISRIRWIKKRF